MRCPPFPRVAAYLLPILLIFCLNREAFSAEGALRLGPLFRDHAVIQRDIPLPIWGWATPGKTIQIEFSKDRIEVETGADGTWRATLPAQAVNAEPATLRVKSDDEEVILQDILVGDVWLCSGQSNMEWRVDQSHNAEAEIAAANFPQIRQIRVPKIPSEIPLDNFDAPWVPCMPDTASKFSAVAYYFARDIHLNLHVPIGLINASWGGKMIEVFMSPESLEKDPHAADVERRWQTELASLPKKIAAYEQDQKSGSPTKRMHPQTVVEQHRPSCLYQSMLHPLIPYGIRGMLWYQGEHNISRGDEYRSLFASFITDLRQKFGLGDFPFYFVQLANFEAPLDKSREGYSKLRESQRHTLALPNVGMAVTIDIGTPDNVHPGNKQDVGARLARLAKSRTYDLDVVDSGPQVHSIAQDGQKLRISFDHTDGGLVVTQNPPHGFEIAGADGVFHPATVEIIGSEITLQSEAVPAPKAVRYGWGNAPQAVLFNGESLPASPFQMALGGAIQNEKK